MSEETQELPEGWCKTDLEGVSRVVTGSTPSKKNPEFYNGSIPFFKPGDLDQDSPISTSVDTVSKEGAEAGRLLPKNTILVSCIGNLGKTAIMDIEGICNQQINALIPSTIIHYKYLYFWCNTLRPWMEQNASATTVSILNKGRFSKAPVLLPPLNEQKRIVAKIEALQARSASIKEGLDRLPALLEKFRQSVLASAFHGDLTKQWRTDNPDVEPASVLLERIRKERKTKWIADEAETMRARAEASAKKNGKAWTKELNDKALKTAMDKAEKKYKAPEPVDTTDLPQLPMGWVWVRLDEITSKIGSGSTPKGGSASYKASGIPLIRSMNVHFYHFEYKNLAFIDDNQAKKLDNVTIFEDDVLLNITGASIGRVIKVPANLKGARVNQHVSIIRCLFNFLSDYIELYLTSPIIQSLIFAEESGATRQAITKQQIESFKIALPPKEEQEIITNTIHRYFHLANNIEKKSTLSRERLNQLNPAILAKAFRGELVPQDPNDEPASVLLERIKAEREAEETRKKEGKKGQEAHQEESGSKEGQDRQEIHKKTTVKTETKEPEPEPEADEHGQYILGFDEGSS